MSFLVLNLKAMTKPQANKMFKTLLLTANRYIIEDAKELIDSGLIDLSEYDNDYLLAKILLQATLERERRRYFTLNKANMTEVENLIGY